MQSIRQAILKKIEEYKQISNEKGFPFPSVEIRFDLRGHTAGQALIRYQNGRNDVMRFNLEIAKNNLEEFLITTVPHEMAHILQYRKDIRAKSHDGLWKYFTYVLTGKVLPRCHEFNTVPARNVKKYLYKCSCMTHKISSIKHNRIFNGKQNYICCKCKSRLYPL
jgi:SprT protein